MPRSIAARFFSHPIPAALLVAIVLPSCRSSGPYDYPTDGTSYLAPDGTIVGPAARRQQRGKPGSTAAALKPREPVWRWEGDGIPGAPSIVIDLGAQQATFYKGNLAVGWTEISSGNEQYPTPPGSFRVQQKSANHVSNLYGDYVDAEGNVVVANIGIRDDPRPKGTRFRGASMPYFLRINGGIGLHAGYLPGYPASHGCIRLPRGAAEVFFRNVSTGTPVKVVP
jgi:hypothetical protein